LAAALARALAGLVDSTERRALLLATVDGERPGAGAMAAALRDAGFHAGAEGWLKTRDTADRGGPTRP
jgi:hypothetical protein